MADRYLELRQIAQMRKLDRNEQFEFDALQRARNAAAQDPSLRQAKAEAARQAAELEQRNAAANTERAFQTIFQTVVPGKPPVLAIDNEANRREILLWLHPGEVVPAGHVRDWFLKVLQETPSLKNRLAWTPYLTPAQQVLERRQNQKQLRERFELACKTHGLDPSTANFNLWSSVPDPVISWFNGRPVILREDGSELELIPATEAQKQEWFDQAQKKAFQQNQEKLAEMAEKGDIQGLRKAAAVETQQKQLTSFEARRNYGMWANFIKRQEYLKEPLPSHYRGQPLTADTIKKGGVEVIRDLGKRCGFERINALLYGLGEDFFVDAEAKLKTLAAGEYHELSFGR